MCTDTGCLLDAEQPSGMTPSGIDFHVCSFRYELEYGAQDFIGVMDEIRIWSTVRSQAQIQEVCVSGCCCGCVTCCGGVGGASCIGQGGWDGGYMLGRGAPAHAPLCCLSLAGILLTSCQSSALASVLGMLEHQTRRGLRHVSVSKYINSARYCGNRLIRV